MVLKYKNDTMKMHQIYQGIQLIFMILQFPHANGRKRQRKMYFPCGHYRGISVLLHLDEITARLPELFADRKTEILDFPKKFCADGRCFTICAREKTAQIFSELTTVPEVYQKSIFEIKV